MNDKKVNRRDFLKSAAILSAGGLLAACAPAAQPAAATKAPESAPTATTAAEAPAATPTNPPPAGSSEKTLEFWSGWGDSTYGQCWKKIVETDEFKSLVGGQNVECKLGIDDTALLTAIAGGTPPDGASNINYIDYMSRDVALPVDDFVKASKVVNKADFLEAQWDIGAYKGKQYGLPAIECFVQQGLTYNEKLVKDAGLDPDKPPETWDDLYEWHKAITKTDASGNVKVIGYNPTDFMGQTIWASSAWDVSTSWGFDWYDENSGKFNLNNDSMVDYFKTSKRFVDLIGMDKMTAFYGVQGQGSWGGAYYSGTLATMLDGYWEPGEIASVSADLSKINRSSWIPVPASKKGTRAQGAGGHIVLVFKGAKHNELMYKISEWLTTQTPSDINFKTVGWLPARAKYLDSVDPKTYTGLEFFLKSAKEATYWGKTYKCPITNFIGTIYPQVREDVYRGNTTPEKAAADLQKRSEDELKKQGF